MAGAESKSDVDLQVMLRQLLYKIHNENCLETLAKLPSECIDLIVTSPPYDDMRTYKGYTFEFEKIAEELSRVLKRGGVLVWVVNDQTINGSETLTSAKQKIYFRENCGLNIHDTMIYQKLCHPNLTHNRYEQCFEYMFVFAKGKPNTFNPLTKKNQERLRNYDLPKKYNEAGKAVRVRKEVIKNKEESYLDNIWGYGTGLYGSTKDKEAFEHPAIFPEALAEDHIRSWSNEGDIVYDPFSGSGTTCKVADRLGRVWLGSEIAEEYCSIALRRISKDLFTKAST